MNAHQTAEAGRPDFPLLVLTAVLSIPGLIVVYSASFVIGLVQYGDSNYFLFRQLLWAALGGVLMSLAMRTDYRRLRSFAVPVMGVTIAILIAVLAVGVETNGARRWLGTGALTVQPAEFAKLTVIIYLAAWLEGKGRTITSFQHGLAFVVIIALISALIMAQPNMGTALIIMVITVTMFWVAGASFTQMSTLAAAGAVALPLFATMASYRADRITAFLHAELDPQGHGFQTLQSLIAIGNGGITGLGLGASRSKFFYIPESHTDGVFAILAEEAGLVAAAAVILLFLLFMVRGFQISRRTSDRFGHLLATGITTWITAQALLNIGGIMRVIPLTGVPLPFLSYGGSALAAELIAVGVLLNISRSGPPRLAPTPPIPEPRSAPARSLMDRSAR